MLRSCTVPLVAFIQADTLVPLLQALAAFYCKKKKKGGLSMATASAVCRL